MTGFMKTVLRLCTKIVGMFLENLLEITVDKYGHVVLRALSASCTLKKAITCRLVQAVEVTANGSNELNKAELELKVKLII